MPEKNESGGHPIRNDAAKGRTGGIFCTGIRVTGVGKGKKRRNLSKEKRHQESLGDAFY